MFCLPLIPLGGGAPGGGIKFVKGAVSARDAQVAEGARTANPDEIAIDEDEESGEEDGRNETVGKNGHRRPGRSTVNDRH